jgi:hypothetical protein
MASQSWRWFVKHRASIGMRVLFYAQLLLTCYQCLIGLLRFHQYYDAERALTVVSHFLHPLLKFGALGFPLIIVWAVVLLRLHPKQALQYVGLSLILGYVHILGIESTIRW